MGRGIVRGSEREEERSKEEQEDQRAGKEREQAFSHCSLNLLLVVVLAGR